MVHTLVLVRADSSRRTHLDHALQDGLVSREEFHSKIVELGSQVDPRVYNIAGCMVMTGTSIGVLTPVLPLLIKQMDISTGQFGLLTSTFCLVKLLGNVPCAWFADRYARSSAAVRPTAPRRRVLYIRAHAHPPPRRTLSIALPAQRPPERCPALLLPALPASPYSSSLTIPRQQDRRRVPKRTAVVPSGVPKAPAA